MGRVRGAVAAVPRQRPSGSGRPPSRDRPRVPVAVSTTSGALRKVDTDWVGRAEIARSESAGTRIAASLHTPLRLPAGRSSAEGSSCYPPEERWTAPPRRRRRRAGHADVVRRRGDEFLLTCGSKLPTPQHRPPGGIAVMTETDHTDPASGPSAPKPHARLRDLDVLEGTWRLEGHDLDGSSPFTGAVTRRWLPGGHFLVQQIQRLPRAFQRHDRSQRRHDRGTLGVARRRLPVHGDPPRRERVTAHHG